MSLRLRTAGSQLGWRLPLAAGSALSVLLVACTSAGLTDVSSPSSASAAPDEAAYVTGDGRVGMRVPPGWFVSREGTAPGGWLMVTLRLGVHNDPPGVDEVHEEPVITLEADVAEPATTMQSLAAELCQPIDMFQAVPSCGTFQAADGTDWSWALIRLFTETRVFAAVTLRDGLVYRAAGTIPDGPNQDATLDTVRSTMASIEIRVLGRANGQA